MRAQSWSNLLEILAIMSLTDDQSNNEFAELFSERAMALKEQICPDVTLTLQMCKDWVEENLDSVRKNASFLHYDDSVYKRLLNLRMLPNKTDLLLILLKVTHSETDFVSNAKNTAILRKAADIWEIKMGIAV